MTRRRFRKQALSPSLFPFLAVLVCTMGALIVLLVLVVQQARVYADTAAERKVSHDEADTERIAQQRMEKEELDWRADVLEQRRDGLAAKLSDKRVDLGHLEDHIRRLEQSWKQLQAQAVEFENIKADKTTDTEQAAAELARLQEAIAETSERLAMAREGAKNRPQAFAIIPYEGVNGTKRRPIYIECTEQGVAIQPEGIVLTRRDFEGPLGPGNPLDAALRTIREHWAQHGSAQQHGEPYPLLIVRPNGTKAYGAARAALKAWDDEFGYELIDGETQLEYPPSDEHLSKLLNATIATARQRQELLIAAMPSEFGTVGRGGLVATTRRGGFRSLSPGGSGGGIGREGEGDFGDGTDGENSFRADPRQGSESFASSGSGQNQDGHHTQHGQNQDGDQTQNGDPNRPMAASQQQGSTRAGPVNGGTGTAASGSNGSAGGRSRRGANWGVPGASGDATAYRIPVRIICRPEAIIILPRPTENKPATQIPAADPLDRSINEFVKALWKQIDGWSEPPLGGFWLPVLEVYVPPGSEGRYVDLRMALRGSGIEVQRQID